MSLFLWLLFFQLNLKFSEDYILKISALPNADEVFVFFLIGLSLILTSRIVHESPFSFKLYRYYLSYFLQVLSQIQLGQSNANRVSMEVYPKQLEVQFVRNANKKIGYQTKIEQDASQTNLYIDQTTLSSTIFPNWQNNRIRRRLLMF